MRQPPPEHSPEVPEPARGGPVRPNVPPGSGGVAYLEELEPDLRGVAIFGPDGAVIECSVPTGSGFADAAASLVGQLEACAREPLDSCHIAADEAGVFVVREGDFTLVAVAARSVLASLMTYDIRMTLRDLATGAGNA